MASSTEHEFVDLQESGLLWLINRVVFHPRGFALGMVKSEPDRDLLGWVLLGDGRMPWTFDDEGDYLARVNRLFAARTSADEIPMVADDG